MSLPPSNAGLSHITVMVDLVIMVTLGLDGSVGGTVQNQNDHETSFQLKIIKNNEYVWKE